MEPKVQEMLQIFVLEMHLRVVAHWAHWPFSLFKILVPVDPQIEQFIYSSLTYSEFLKCKKVCERNY